MCAEFGRRALARRVQGAAVMKQLSLLLLGASLALGCGDDAGTSAGADAATAPDASAPESVRYESPFYEDPADCPDDPLFNCTPSLELCADGTATMLVTDIINGGIHEREGEIIATEWGPGDVPPEIGFTASDDGALLTDDWQGWDWSLADGGPRRCD